MVENGDSAIAIHASGEKRRENMREKQGQGRRTWDICKPDKIHLGFFLRRRGLGVDNNNKFSRQFLQVTFEILRMSQVPLSLSRADKTEWVT